MKISVDDAGMTARVILTGKLDEAGANTIAAALAKLSENKHGLIIDLSDVSYLSSMGIRQLLTTAKTLTRRGGRLVLLKPSKPVEEVLTLSAINSLIPIAHNDKEAQAVLAAALGG